MIRFRAPTTIVAAAVFACAGACSALEQRASAATAADSIRADSLARARQDSINRTLPGYVVDSARPVEEELRRFRAAIGGDSAVALRDPSPSRDALIARFAAAVERRDTAEFARMAVTAREFADLVYPTSPYVAPPYKQAPGLVWFQLQNGSSVGLTRLLNRRGGRPLKVSGHSCPAAPEVQGRNRLWNGCTVRTTDPAGTVQTERLFASILERDGAFKILSFANDY